MRTFLILFLLALPATASTCAQVVVENGTRVLAYAHDLHPMFLRSTRQNLIRVYDEQLAQGPASMFRPLNTDKTQWVGNPFAFLLNVGLEAGVPSQWTPIHTTVVGSLTARQERIAVGAVKRMTERLFFLVQHHEVSSQLVADASQMSVYAFGIRYYMAPGEYPGVNMHLDGCRYQAMVILQRAAEIEGGESIFAVVENPLDIVRTTSGPALAKRDPFVTLPRVNHLLGFDGSNTLHGSAPFRVRERFAGDREAAFRDVIGICIRGIQ